MKTITHIDNVMKINKIISNSNLSDEDCKFIGKVILETLDFEEELLEKLKLVNKMNAENYNKYCQVLTKYNQLKRRVEKDAR